MGLLAVAYSVSCLDPELLAKIAGLTLRARAVVEGTVTGLHRSPFHGFSVEFAEHREYSPGDDLKYVDWKVFGRTDKFYVKQFEQETNLSCMILVDGSESMRFKSADAPLSKWEYAQCVAAALAYIVLGQQDRVGLGVFSEGFRTYLRPEAAGGQWQLIVDALEKEKPQGKTAIDVVLHEMAERLTRRGLVVLISDFLSELSGVERGLKHLRYAAHEVIVFHVLDPQEIEFNLHQPVVLKALEQAGQVAVDPYLIRHSYQRCVRAFLSQLQRICHSLHIDYVRIVTRDRLDHAIREYVASRRRMRRA